MLLHLLYICTQSNANIPDYKCLQLHYSTIHFTALHFTTLHYATHHYTFLNLLCIQYTNPQKDLPHYTTIQYNRSQTNTALPSEHKWSSKNKSPHLVIYSLSQQYQPDSRLIWSTLTGLVNRVNIANRVYRGNRGNRVNRGNRGNPPPPPSVTLRGPPWILKRGVLESSG